LSAIADEDLVDADLHPARAEIVGRDRRAQELVADVRTVALEGLAPRHVVGGLVNSANDGRGQGLGHVADPQIDQANVGMRVGEHLRPATDLGEQVVLVEVQVELVEAGHGASRANSNRRDGASSGALRGHARSYKLAARSAYDIIARRRSMGIAAMWLALVVAMLGLVGRAVPASAQPAGTLVVGLVAEPVNLDPAQVTDLNSNRVGRRIAETLVTFPDESTQVVAGLAESWTISKDGLRYTFKLRRNVTFHDGTPFNAEAVKFSIERQIDPEHPANKLGKYPFANYFFGNVKAVEVVDASTVEFVLKEPRASFLTILTAAAASKLRPTPPEKHST